MTSFNITDFAEGPLRAERDSRGVVTLTLDDPKRFNALGHEMLAALQKAFGGIAKDESVRVVVLAANGDALYFSRAPVPWPRDAFARDRTAMPQGRWLRHIGIYGYRVSALRAFAALSPGTLERTESLEQLRALEAGWRIAVALAPSPFPPGVDTPEDLARAERTYQDERNRT